MSASEAADGSSPVLCPSFAVICSFLERYGALLDLPEVSFPALERGLLESGTVPKVLVDLHVKLLRKICKSVTADRWEKYLVKICQELNSTWAWELENKGYREMTVECKTEILKYLCECQFDDNVKFKTAINEEDPDKMRLQPIGKDKDGLMYWFQLDLHHNVRVYVEEQDDLDGSSWKCVVRNRDDLAQILGLLKTQIDPALLVKKDQEEGTNPNPDDENTKKDGAEASVEESKDDLSSENKENLTEKENIMQEDADATSNLKMKEEPQKDSETTKSTSVIITSIKEEPKDEEEKVKEKESSTTSTNAEQMEDVKRKALEEAQRALKIDHQAKMPLKKREMKLTDNFDSNFAGLRNVPIKETRMSSEENRSSVEKINGHVPHLQKETENKSENLPHADRVKDICVEQKVSSETRLCATEHIEVEKTLGEGKPENTPNSASCEVAKENISAQSSESNKDIPNLDREEVSVQEVSVIASAKSLPKDDAAKVVVIKQTPKDIKSEETNKGVSKEDTPNQESRKCLLNNDLIKDSPVKESSSECSVKDPPREEAREDVPNVESRKVEEQVTVVKKSSTSEELLSDGPNKDSKQGLIQDSLKEPSKHSSNQDSLKDSLPPKDLPKEQAMGDVSKEKSMKNFPNAEPIKERVEKESPKAVDGESPKSDKDSSSVDKKLGPEPEEAEQSKSEEDASRGETKALPATERPNVIKDIKSLRTSTENVFQAEKHCESEQEKLPSSEEKGSVVSNLGDESDSHQNKDQRDSENNDISETSTKETVADGSEKPVESSISEKSESDPVSGDGNKEMQMEVDAEVSKSGMNLSKTKEKEDDGSGGQSKDSEKEQPEVSSEVQEMSDNTMKASGRRPGRPSNKFKKAAHRRKAELQREEEKRDSDSEPSDGRCLRRSARISRPSAKAVETQDRKVERKQPSPVKEREKEEEEEEEEEKQQEEEEEPVQRKPRKVEGDGQPKPKVGRRRKRQLWSRMKRKKKSSDDEEDEESESEEEETEVDDSDEDYKVEKTKRRRRNRHRERRSSDSSTSSSENDEPNDDPCKHCGLPNHPELILLCDSCDNGYHTACLRPPLMIIPDGEWFCPPCQHKLLCDRLEEQLVNLDAALKKKERAERRKERLVYVGISLENIITPSVEVEEEKEEVVKEKVHVKKSKSWGRRSTRAKKYISYRFDEFDEAIEEAIEEDIKEAEGGGAGRGKDMANITGHRGKDMSTILQEEGKENGRPKKTSSVQKKKRRRLNDLDSDSTVDEEESEDEFRLSNSSEEEEFVVSDNDAESEEDAPSFEGSDFDSDAGRQRVKANRFKINRRRQPPRRRRRPRGYSDEEEMESDEEEEEEEMVTEGSSEFSDSDLDVRCRRSYRSQKQMVNYCETSDTEASQASTNKDKKKKRRRLSSSDSEVNFQSADSEEDERKPKKMRVDSSEEESKKQRRRLSLKRRRESEDDDDDDDSDDSEEEDRPIRKRVNRIDSDDSESEEEEVKKKPKETEEKSAATGPLEHNSAEPPPTNGQNPVKATEGIVPRPKNSTTIASNGLENAAQEEDEDDLLGVTDLVDYVCNSEQL